MATETKRRKNTRERQGSRKREDEREPKRSKQEYQEEDGWSSAFHRPDNEGNQPQYTGQGLDPDGNPIEVAIWIRRAKSGAKYLRIHIQEPYQQDDRDDDLDDEPESDDEDDDDLPF